MISGRDIFILAALSVDARVEDATIRSISEELGVPHAGVQRSIARLSEAGVYLPRRRAVVSSLAVDLLTSGSRFLVPPKYLGQGRGISTAWYDGPLASRIRASGEELPVVWADPEGASRGILLEPIDPAVPRSARANPSLGDLLRAIDAARIGGAREREVAAAFIRESVEQAQWAIA